MKINFLCTFGNLQKNTISNSLFEPLAVLFGGLNDKTNNQTECLLGQININICSGYSGFEAYLPPVVNVF